MKEKRKLKLKKFYFHPITVFLFLTLVIIILSGILSTFEMQATYNTINPNTNELEPTLVAVKNLFSFDGMKFLIGDATTNFISFAPLGTLLLALIGITIAEATGLIETLSKRFFQKMPKEIFTFIIIFVATISSLINEVGYAILIPLVALRTAAWLVDDTMHISLTSNLFFIIATSIIISIIGTLVIEKIIAPKIGKYKKEEEFAKTEQYSAINLEEEEQKRIEKDKYERRGLRFSLITCIIVILLFIYMLIPSLPYSGMLLDMNENTYLNQLFGDNSYFQSGFTYLITILLILTGLAYGFGAKSIKSDKKLIEEVGNKFSKTSYIFILIFVVSQFIAVFKETNIGVIITAWLANLLEHLEFSGIPLIIITLIIIALSNLVLTSPTTKWMIFSPIVVPMFMQTNISPQFAQVVMRIGNSMTNGFTPILASFVIYVGYLNIYNLNKNKPYTIRKCLKIITPYFLIIFATWILIVIGWYITGLPLGPGVFPTL